MKVFDRLDDLPRHGQISGTGRTPNSVEALRTAAAGAHATLLITAYHGCISAKVHNAIDWLTRCNGDALHDRPLAVMGPAAGCYSGVWSRHQTERDNAGTGRRVVEPLIAESLREAVEKLAGEVNA